MTEVKIKVGPVLS